MNEKYFLFGVAGFIISIFGIIIYFAVESQLEGKINDEFIDFENINKLNSDAKEIITNSTVMRDFKQFIQESSEEIKEKINPKNNTLPQKTKAKSGR